MDTGKSHCESLPIKAKSITHRGKWQKIRSKEQMETPTQPDHTEGRPTPEEIREEHTEETIEEERNHRLNMAARRRLERNTTPFAHRGTPTLTPRRMPRITRDRIISYGMTTGCRGCESAFGNGMAINHNDKCRERFDNINREEEGDRRDETGTDGESTDPDMPSFLEPMEVEAHKEELRSINYPTIDWSDDEAMGEERQRVTKEKLHRVQEQLQAMTEDYSKQKEKKKTTKKTMQKCCN